MNRNHEECEAKAKAEAEIGKILAQLEIETGSIVEDISIESIDISHAGGQQQLQKTIITLRRQPGTRWA